MIETHDPYLNTVKRSLNEERIKTRKKKIETTKVIPKNFWAKNIIISEYIYLPESLQNLFLIILFVAIPYLFGVLVLFIILSYAAFEEYTVFNLDAFMFTWTVGYETIAFILLLLIIKSSFSFRKK